KMDTYKEDKKLTTRKKNKEVSELVRNSYSQKSLIREDEERQSDVTEVEAKSDLNLSENITQSPPTPGLYLRLEINLVFLGLLVLALFDELHYGRYVSLYTKGVFFFDAHPPLGKQLLYLAGRVAGYDGNFTFDRIGTPYTENVPVTALRLIPALSGSMLVAVIYQLMLEISVYHWTAVLAGLLVLFAYLSKQVKCTFTTMFSENCFLAQSRFMLLESIQILFGLCGVLCAIRSTRRTGFASVVWLCFAAFSLGCCFSVKYSGLYSYFLVVFLVGRQIWQRVGQRGSGLRLALSALWRLSILIIIPSSVYVGVFYAHLTMLPKAGPHDSVMTSAFQASLQGGLASITRGQPLHVAHGSQITLRHTHGRTCWLHSHAHVYPVRYTDGRGSSHQQQVTCYSFKDVNNWWIVKRPDQASLTVSRPPDAIRHGDVVQLLHGITSRALNSHDVAAPVSPQSQEVSCYIDYNVSMPAQNLWRIDIVNRDSEDATWDSIRSLVRLIHVDSGSALRFSGRQLPSWGFHQHEVVADKVLTHQDTIWNVEEHRYTKAEDRKERERELVSAEMIPTAVTQLTFWEKFAELQYKMIAHAPDAPHGHMFATWLAYIIITFKKFSVLNYGNINLTENDLLNLRWKDTWDFIIHKKG
ncbi:hypothetical protein HF086_015714, partial [Spodoptera exigua]